MPAGARSRPLPPASQTNPWALLMDATQAAAPHLCRALCLPQHSMQLPGPRWGRSIVIHLHPVYSLLHHAPSPAEALQQESLLAKGPSHHHALDCFGASLHQGAPRLGLRQPQPGEGGHVLQGRVAPGLGSTIPLIAGLTQGTQIWYFDPLMSWQGGKETRPPPGGVMKSSSYQLQISQAASHCMVDQLTWRRKMTKATAR